jgi:hypothetical protein
MKETRAMTAFEANPIATIVPAILLAAVGLYFLYGAVDRLGLPIQSAPAIVTAKQVSPGTTTSWTNIAGGRAWVQSALNPDNFAISLDIGNEPSVALVSKPVFDALRPGDRVTVGYTRSRLGGALEVVQIDR